MIGGEKPLPPTANETTATENDRQWPCTFAADSTAAENCRGGRMFGLQRKGKTMTIDELLEALDGAGLVLTDDELIDETLANMGIDRETEIPVIEESTGH